MSLGLELGPSQQADFGQVLSMAIESSSRGCKVQTKKSKPRFAISVSDPIPVSFYYSIGMQYDMTVL